MFWATLLGCPQEGPDGGPPQDACPDAPTWDDFAQGYVQTWCTPCHSASLVGDARQLAPPGVDFDTWSQVHAMRDLVAARATGTDPAMPPLGGVPEEDVARFAQWLACGAEGEDDPPGPCDTLTVGPSATVATAADADAVCASGNAIAALTVTGTASIGCLCAVEGDLVLGPTAGAVDLPLLATVTGSVRADPGALSALRAPALRTVGGDVVVAAAPALAELDLRGLETVGGDLVASDLAALGAVSLDGLYSVGGGLEVARDPLLASLDLPRLRTVGDALVLRDLPALTELLGTSAVEQVGADLVLEGLDTLPVLDDFGFWFVESVGGDLVVRENAELVGIHGFTLLADVGGDVVIEDDPELVRIEGFDNLVHVGGDLRIARNVVQESVNGLIALEDVDGTLLLEDLPALVTLPGLAESLTTVGGLHLVRIGAPTLPPFLLAAVDGDLALLENPVLADVTGLATVTAITGNVDVRDNPSLSQATIDSWLAGVEVSGTITASGNAP